MHIGHSIYQDDFNKLHFLKKYKPKLIDIIFNDKQSLTTNFKMIKLPIQNNLLIERLLDQNDWNNQFENILNCLDSNSTDMPTTSNKSGLSLKVII